MLHLRINTQKSLLWIKNSQQTLSNRHYSKSSQLMQEQLHVLHYIQFLYIFLVSIVMCFHVFLPKRKTALSQERSTVILYTHRVLFITIKENKKGCKTHPSNFKRKYEMDYQGN